MEQDPTSTRPQLGYNPEHAAMLLASGIYAQALRAFLRHEKIWLAFKSQVNDPNSTLLACYLAELNPDDAQPAKTLIPNDVLESLLSGNHSASFPHAAQGCLIDAYTFYQELRQKIAAAIPLEVSLPAEIDKILAFRSAWSRWRSLTLTAIVAPQEPYPAPNREVQLIAYICEFFAADELLKLFASAGTAFDDTHVYRAVFARRAVIYHQAQELLRTTTLSLQLPTS